jgi:hypothetical protein
MDASRKHNGGTLMPAWPPGKSGNPGGRPKGFTRLLRELMSKTELCGEILPGGRTVEQALVEAAALHAIKGNASILNQIIERLEGPVRDRLADEIAKSVVFEIIPNGRERPAELESNPADGSADPPENESNG